jgi:ring-1,2-phenylacetyl-CoA epoxidase subunit PaaC
MGPVLEEDIALTNMALDLIGQARAAHPGRAASGQGFDEDQLAFLRDERDYRNPTLAELPLPRGDFAFTVLRNLMVATWLKLLWQRLRRSSDAELAAIAGKALKEARYHQQHAADWVVRLGDGTEESPAAARRAGRAVALRPELFEADATDAAAAAAAWARLVGCLRGLAGRDRRGAGRGRARTPPAPAPSAAPASAACTASTWATCWPRCSTLQRAYPGGVW